MKVASLDCFVVPPRNDAKRSRESKQQIPKEIPKRRSPNGEDLAQVEVPLQLAVEQPHRERVDAQAHQGDAEILHVFHPDLRVAALEGPDAVEEVVGRGRHHETQDVAQVFVPLQPLLAHVGDAKVDEHTRQAHHPELQELQEERTVEFYVEQRGFHWFFLFRLQKYNLWDTLRVEIVQKSFFMGSANAEKSVKIVYYGIG